MDVDLRQLPALIGKKRSSMDSPENIPKKSKAEVFDRYKTNLRRSNQFPSNITSDCRLFGDEDTDLRQLPIASDKPSPVRQRISPIRTGHLSPMNKDNTPPTIEISPDVSIVESDRPPTPPPPIISSNRDSPKRAESPRKNLDVLRAKLANATNRDKSKLCKYFIKNIHQYFRCFKFRPDAHISKICWKHITLSHIVFNYLVKRSSARGDLISQKYQQINY